MLSTASRSQAELLAYDPFLIGSNPAAGEYTVGLLGGQNPTIPFFSGPWVAPSATGGVVQEQTLSFLGAPAAGGSATNALLPDPENEGEFLNDFNGRTGRHFATPWDASTVGTFYIGFIANFGSTESNDMGYRSVEFWESGGTIGNDGNRIMEIGYSQFGNYNGAVSPGSLQQDPNTARMAFNVRGQGAQLIEGAPQSYNQDGANHLIVFKFELSDQPDSDTVSVFLNPTTLEEPSFANASGSGLNFTLGAFSTVSGFGGQVHGTMDEIRIGTTFSDVVPDFPLPGDTNNDGFVDELDFNAIFANMNRTGVTTAEGDVTGDGRVSLADYRLWKDNRTDLGPFAASQNIPEPSGMILMLVAIGALAGRRSRR